MRYMILVCVFVLVGIVVAVAQQPPEGLERKPPLPKMEKKHLAPPEGLGKPDRISQEEWRQKIGKSLREMPTTGEQDIGTQVVTVKREWTTIEIVLSVAILLFALLVFVLQSIMMVRLKLEWTPQSILRFNGITLIISGALLLVVAGYSNQQVAPVMGLLGTIAGYLLGARERTEK